MANTLPRFATLPRTSPPETFRVAGRRIASAPHRFSGRTAMDADRNVREPQPPVSADSPFSTTMEGYYGKMPPALLPFFWSPGWNSVQSVNKFQAEIGGALEGGDPGVRLLEALPEAVLPYYISIPEAFAPRAGMWRAVVLPRVFGDDEQSAGAAPIRERMEPPTLALNDEGAALIGATPGQMLICELDGEQQYLTFEIRPELPRGVAGIAGLATKAHVLPQWTCRLGFWQDRYGPNRAGPYGVLQAAADGIKLLFKQDWTPPFADAGIFVLAPAIAMVTVLLALAAIPATPVIGIVGNLNIGLLYFLAMSGLGVYAVVLAGWSSNNKFSLLGGMRAAAQMVSYEVFMGLSLVGVVMIAGSFNLTDIVHSQRHLWFVVPQFLGFIVFLLGGIAETHRLPFDLPEGESELGAGFHTEYSGMKFGMFFIGEYIGIMLVSAMTTILFLGGWYGPVLPPVLWLGIKTGFLVGFFILLRAALPRPRYDQFMTFGWKLLLPLMLLNILVTGALMPHLQRS